MNKRFYKKGEQIDAMSFAGEDCWTWSALGITANVFISDDTIQIPLISSENLGSGQFDNFLEELKREAGGKKLIFNTVVNEGLKKHLKKAGIEFN